MKNRTLLLVATVMAITPAAWAQTQMNVQTMKGPGHATVKGTTRATATVESIDAANRTVMLKTPQGKEIGRLIEAELGENLRKNAKLVG